MLPQNLRNLNFGLGEFPQSFDQVEVRGVRRQEQQLYAQPFGFLFHLSAVLVAGVVEHQRNRPDCPGGEFDEQLHHRVGRDTRGVADPDQRSGHRIPSAQDVVPLPARCPADKHPHHTPQATQERPTDEMRCVHEVDIADTGFGFG
jgi:hypothetical protein